ncbi:hypothetical protein BDN67DRAFT_976274 [Paxillus ammoniavirescens]|nr:hypothetical protein BDN67DRAFT_976274 [Paxillus ammoniavirescens]
MTGSTQSTGGPATPRTSLRGRPIELFSRGGNSKRMMGHGRLMESHGVRWCMHSGSAMMSMMQTTGPVLMGSGPMSKEGRAGGETDDIFVRSVLTGACIHYTVGRPGGGSPRRSRKCVGQHRCDKW